PSCSINTGASKLCGNSISQSGRLMHAERRRSRFRWAKSALHAALILVLIAASSATGRADGGLERLIRHDIAPMAPENGAGGAAVAVYVAGAASFFNFGL